MCGCGFVGSCKGVCVELCVCMGVCKGVCVDMPPVSSYRTKARGPGWTAGPQLSPPEPQRPSVLLQSNDHRAYPPVGCQEEPVGECV